jgi:hypothetical protein
MSAHLLVSVGTTFHTDTYTLAFLFVSLKVGGKLDTKGAFGAAVAVAVAAPAVAVLVK